MFLSMMYICTFVTFPVEYNFKNAFPLLIIPFKMEIELSFLVKCSYVLLLQQEHIVSRLVSEVVKGNMYAGLNIG